MGEMVWEGVVAMGVAWGTAFGTGMGRVFYKDNPKCARATKMLG